MLEEDEWKVELPSPGELDWEDVKDQVKETSDEEDDRVQLLHEPTGMTAGAEEYKTRSENLELARDRMVENIREQLELEEEEREEQGPSLREGPRSPGEERGLPGEDEPPEPEGPPRQNPPDPRP